MSVSQTAEYALRAVVWLAQNPGAPQTTQQLATGTQVSVSYLPKVLQPLGRAGILTSQRGINGGYSLDRDPEDLSVLEVISCVDPIQRITRCPLKLSTHTGGLCPLHRMLDDAIADLERRYAETTIAGLLRQESNLKPLCEDGPGVVQLDLGPPS
ncbi:HTH-type transcriptional regulator IscR [Planctomycetes bacterium MalM25]|nr:HTH-type transcriptional regulator IscR [Planctomycetes bacterium MalM25]